jgi:hypothetical protein
LKDFCFTLGDDDRLAAVESGIIPSVYKLSEFSEEKIKKNLIAQYIRYKGAYKVYNFSEYIKTCNGIIAGLKMGKLPDRSYLIGAPNGFGKSSFVTESLILLNRQGYRAVPYISLWELAQLRADAEHRLLKPFKYIKDTDKPESSFTYYEANTFKGFVKTPEIVTGRFSYSEYINADCLFVSFTDVVSKEIESHALYQLLNIRGAKGLPTIAMISTSLDPYENDKALREQVWDEIKMYSRKKDNKDSKEIEPGCYDRVTHVSCYKMKELKLDSRGRNIDSDTGIVN